VISGGDGVDAITGGTGRDALTGGAGADVFSFAANATDAVVSSAAATDTISDFTSGTDKLDVGAVSFLGNFTNVTQALAANAVAGTPNRSAAFVTSENNLYVFTTGAQAALNVLDTVITLTGVTSITGADLLIGAQGTGNAITVSAISALSTNTASNAAVRATTAGTNTPVDAATTTAGDDTVSANVSFLAGSTLTGGLGSDTLALSLTTVGGGAQNDTVFANITGFERMTLGNYAPTAAQANQTYNLALAAATVADNTTLTVVSSYAGLQADQLTTGNMTFSAALLGATSRLNFTGAAANDAVTGGAGADTISGGTGNDTISGGAGNDVLNGDGGNDSITADAGDDNISGGDGNDTIVMAVNLTAADTISGGTGGTDTLTVTNTGAAIPTAFDNVTGVETITFTGNAGGAAINAITVTAASAFATDTTATTISTDAQAVTFNFANRTSGITVVTGAGADFVTGGAGNDVITGGGGTDSLVGGAGDDVFVVALVADFAGAETITGGTGNDTIRFTDEAANATLTLVVGVTDVDNLLNVTLSTAGTQRVNADGLGDTISVNITGNAGNNILTGNAIADTLSGGDGDDTLNGGAGNDSLVGGAGADQINGDAGADTITGGEGADQISVGSGLNSVILTETTAAADVVRLTDAGSANVTTITGFATTGAAVDIISLFDGALTPTGGVASTLAFTNGRSATAGDVDVFVTAGTSAGTVNAAAALGVIKLTGAAASFAGAIGTTSITLDVTVDGGDANTAVEAGELISTIWYDSVNGQLVIGAVDSSTDGTIGNITQNDTFYEMARITMTAADFALFNAANLTYFA